MPKITRSRSIPMSFVSAVRALRARGTFVLVGTQDGTGTLSFELAGTGVSRPIRVGVRHLDVLTEPIAIAVLPFRIEATEHPGWTPLLDAELEVVRTSSGVEVTLDGEYRVPGSIAGSVLDRLVLHGKAEESIDDLFSHVLLRLQSVGSDLDALTGVPW